MRFRGMQKGLDPGLSMERPLHRGEDLVRNSLEGVGDPEKNMGPKFEACEALLVFQGNR